MLNGVTSGPLHIVLNDGMLVVSTNKETKRVKGGDNWCRGKASPLV